MIQSKTIHKIESMLTEDRIRKNKEEIISLLKGVKRDGIMEVITYLENSGFFTAPSSISRHHNWKGGLAEHSLGVYHQALMRGDGLPNDSLVITGLLHDICKATKFYVDSDGIIRRRYQHLKGHGYRSVKLLERCQLILNDEERQTIRWHMGGHHASEKEQDEVYQTRKLKLWQVIHEADVRDAKSGSPI